MALPRPVHQQVTHTVSPLFSVVITNKLSRIDISLSAQFYRRNIYVNCNSYPLEWIACGTGRCAVSGGCCYSPEWRRPSRRQYAQLGTSTSLRVSVGHPHTPGTPR